LPGQRSIELAGRGVIQRLFGYDGAGCTLLDGSGERFNVGAHAGRETRLPQGSRQKLGIPAGRRQQQNPLAERPRLRPLNFHR
jgi:hypothetical protein